MVVLTTENRRTYTGDGTTTQFSFPIFFLDGEHVKVALRIDDVESKPVFGVDYTVTGAGNPAGGTVTFVVAPPAAAIVVLFNDPPQTQTVDYQDNDEFPAETHERALDKLTILVQRLLANLDRTLRFSETEQDLISASELLQRIEEAKTARDESVASAAAASGSETKASEWADKDTEVEPGRNSSKTWAGISEQWARTVDGPALRADIDTNTANIAANTAAIAGILPKSRRVLTVGSGTYTTPAGCRRLEILAAGGGGGGGYSKPNPGQAAVGGGGGGGEVILHAVDSPDATYSYTVGAGGNGGVAASSTAATDGANTTFGSIVTAKGGSGGGASSSTTTPGGSALGGAGGGRAVAGTGDIIITGSPGAPGVIFSGTICQGGVGGSGPYGGAGDSKFAPSSGIDGRGFGAGGSGAANTNNSNANGGAGADGVIIVNEYY